MLYECCTIIDWVFNLNTEKQFLVLSTSRPVRIGSNAVFNHFMNLNNLDIAIKSLSSSTRGETKQWSEIAPYSTPHI